MDCWDFINDIPNFQDISEEMIKSNSCKKKEKQKQTWQI